MEKILCSICGAATHAIRNHLKEAHEDWTIDKYKETYPDSPLMSEFAMNRLKERLAEKRAAEEGATVEMSGSGTALSTANVVSITKNTLIKRPLHEIFDLGSAPDAKSKKGDPIMLTTLGEHDYQDMVPAVSDDYVYDIDELKNATLAIELNIPTLVWGHKGSGKSELLEQLAARTNRPFIRIQHTVNTEESHIIGQYVVKGGATVFELGPLPLAMMNGFIYCADEYDFGMPSVLAVYQSVLEGKALVIKEAPPEYRVIKPHANFRFVSTGNTNGSGDETGLYQGTMMQNSANYDRFGMVINKKYMESKAESLILQRRCKLAPVDADKMVEFAKLVRDAYAASKISDTVSPRSLINASKIGVYRGSFKTGLILSFINKLSKVDKEVVEGLAQRVFG